jgi:DNA topoisomerase-1
MEELAIGRPSTYAPTIATVVDREYVEKDGKALKPTDLGFRVNEQLVQHFPDIVDIGFTSRMEQNLDSIEEGDREWVALLQEFYDPFVDSLKKAETQMQAVAMPSGELCPTCGKQLLIKSTWRGEFLGCEDYPNCKTTRPIVKRLGMACKRPECEGEILIKRTRTGKTFYGCERYMAEPKCEFTSWDEPTNFSCEKCGTFMVKKFPRATAKSRRPFLMCSNAECKNIQNIPYDRKKKDDTAEAGSEGDS